MTPGTDEARYVRQKNIVARRVGGETLLVPTNSKTVDTGSRAAELFVLNDSGERMWEWLGNQTTIADLARNLMEEFDVTPQAAHDDAETFIRALAEVGLVVRTPIDT